MKETKGTGPGAKAVMKTDPRASRFLKTARDLSNKHWEEIFAAATEFLNASRKCKQSQSASFHASSDFIVDILEPEYTFIRKKVIFIHTVHNPEYVLEISCTAQNSRENEK